MRYTADREGHKWQESTGQDKLLEKLYGSAVGRCILRPLVSPVVRSWVAGYWTPGYPYLLWNPLSEGMESIGRIMKKKNILHIMIFLQGN